MKRTIRITLTAAILIIGAMNVMAIEEAAYKVVEKDKQFEIRDYAPHILAETIVGGSLEDAGNSAFMRLFHYISGDNQTHGKVPMTAPVAQQPAHEKWAVSFMMPAASTLGTLPVPADPKVTLRPVPARRIAAVRYSGFWSHARYLKFKAELESWIRAKGLTVAGDPVWARYNPPFTLWFLRRNEILIPVNKN